MSRLVRRRTIIASFVGTIAALAIAAAWALQDRVGNLTAIRAAADRIAPLHQPKSKPGPNDWLARHNEPGQTVEAYVRSDPNRPNRVRTTIYVQPLGDFNAAQQHLVDEVSDLLGRFYNVPVKSLPPLSLDVIPESARRRHERAPTEQLLAPYILDVLKPRRPHDAVALIALTTSDIYPEPSWNFLFGLATFDERVGVWSMARFGDAEKQHDVVLNRMSKLAIHEMGHMFGLEHCIRHQCSMNGTNHLDETDAVPLGFCPDCEQKVWWACRADPAARYRSLAEFAEKHQLDQAAELWRKSLAAFKEPAPSENSP